MLSVSFTCTIWYYEKSRIKVNTSHIIELLTKIENTSKLVTGLISSLDLIQ